jgi:predicted negative regulator of RcsB-dependent stress response
MAELIDKFGVQTGLVIMAILALGKAGWSIYNRMADRLDSTAQQHLDLIKQLQKESAENNHQYLESFSKMMRENNVVISNNTETMTRLMDRIDAENAMLLRASKSGSGNGVKNHG